MNNPCVQPTAVNLPRLWKHNGVIIHPVTVVKNYNSNYKIIQKHLQQSSVHYNTCRKK